jgi:hypothetical protein
MILAAARQAFSSKCTPDHMVDWTRPLNTTTSNALNILVLPLHVTRSTRPLLDDFIEGSAQTEKTGVGAGALEPEMLLTFNMESLT